MHFIAYDAAISAYETHYITIGITLGTGDSLIAYSNGTPLSFSAFGSEVV
jgi:hypothetical protein